MSAAFIHDGTAGHAARHLLDHSALAYVTRTTPDPRGGVKVELSTPRPSSGERILFQALMAFATDIAGFDIAEAARHLDRENLIVLHEAIGVRFGLTAVAS